MLKYPQIDPVIFTLGPLQPRWYGLMYLLGFLYTFHLLKKHARWIGFDPEKADSILATLVFGLIVTARVVYVVFYNLKGTWETMMAPLSREGSSLGEILVALIEPIAIWNGGLAFHGGLLGVVLGGWYVARKYQIKWQRLTDVLALATPVGLGLGRIANFINGELWGRVTDVPWGMVFPGAGNLPRHPSQLYEALLEGLVLFVLLRLIWGRRPKVGVVSASFLLLYALFRTSVELVREPDVQVGFLFGGITMGQLLSSVMVIYGSYLMWQSLTQGEAHDTLPAVAPGAAAEAASTKDADSKGSSGGKKKKKKS